MEYSLHQSPSFQAAVAGWDEELKRCLARLLQLMQEDPLTGSLRLIGTRHLRRRRLAAAGMRYRVIYAIDARTKSLVVVEVRRRDQQTYCPKRLAPLDDEADAVIRRLREREGPRRAAPER